MTACAALLLAACSQIDTGNVGVERTLGKVGTEARLAQALRAMLPH